MYKAMLPQLWLVALIGMMARASPTARLAIALGVAALSALALPSNLWRPQLKRLGLLAAFIFVATAIGAGTCTSCSPQTIAPPAAAATATAHCKR